MPVIKGQPRVKTLDEGRRNALITRLGLELANKGDVDGPTIFEIPLDQSDRMDVLVVWHEFHDLRAEDRTGLIMQAYGGNAERIAQALGVTQAEAVEQGLLPYRVVAVTQSHGSAADELKKAMLGEGGFLTGGDVDLRLPTQTMAIEAIERLSARIPGMGWRIES